MEHLVMIESMEMDTHVGGIPDTVVDGDMLEDPVDYTQDEVLKETYKEMEMYLIKKAGGSDAWPTKILRSGLIYDPAMRRHWDNRADEEHPEDPRRILCIYKMLCESGLYDETEEDLDYPDLSNRPDKLVRIPFQDASPWQVLLVHSPEHMQNVQLYSQKAHEGITDEFRWWCDMQSVYFSELTFKCAMISCGGAIEACRAVLNGEVKNSIAVIRPPGHHADLDGAKGFCMFNNVGVAIRAAQEEFKTCKKVLILDWDVHHGNGTQDIFESDPNVLFISLHVFRNDFYPIGPKGDLDKCGIGEGVGKNINIPWPRVGMEDADYIHAFNRVVMPVAREFDPDFVVISAGFDAAEGDPLGGCHVSPECYAWMTRQLMTLAGGKVAVCLEGGYNLLSISKSAVAVARALVGLPPERLPFQHPSADGRKTVDAVCKIQEKYWTVLASPAKAALKHDQQILDKPLPLSEALRHHQSRRLYETCDLIEVPLLLSSGFHVLPKQVLATPKYWRRKTVLVFVHELPLLTLKSDQPSIRNAEYIDAFQPYLEEAKRANIGVIDIAVSPDSHVSEEGIEDELAVLQSTVQKSNELCLKVWDDMLEQLEDTRFFFIGVGDASSGIVRILIERESHDSTVKVFMFIAENSIRSVDRDTDVDLADWYYHNSAVYVSETHACWKEERKPRKRFGKITPCKQHSLPGMLAARREEVWASIREKARADEV